LFSGGLDCTVLARMMHDLLPQDYQIDLLNVAFQNPRAIKAAKNLPKAKKQVFDATEEVGMEHLIDSIPEDGTAEASPFELCPDRETGRKAFQELNRVCANRMWRFVAMYLIQRQSPTDRT